MSSSSLPEIDREEKEEDREEHRGPISRKRIESLSDLIFGLSLSIGAITLITQPPTTPDEMTSRIIAFIFNFVILVAVWLQYTTIISKLPVETGRVVFANVLLLLLIILMSYLANGIHYVNPPLPIPAFTALDDYSSQLYALDLAGVTAIIAFLSHHLLLQDDHLLPAEFLRKVGLARNVIAFFALLFLVTALPQLWDWRIAQVPLRFALWWVPLIGTIYLDVLFFLKPKGP